MLTDDAYSFCLQIKIFFNQKRFIYQSYSGKTLVPLIFGTEQFIRNFNCVSCNSKHFIGMYKIVKSQPNGAEVHIDIFLFFRNLN